MKIPPKTVHVARHVHGFAGTLRGLRRCIHSRLRRRLGDITLVVYITGWCRICVNKRCKSVRVIGYVAIRWHLLDLVLSKLDLPSFSSREPLQLRRLILSTFRTTILSRLTCVSRLGFVRRWSLRGKTDSGHHAKSSVDQNFVFRLRDIHHDGTIFVVKKGM